MQKFNVSKRIIFSVSLLMGFTIITAIIASVGFYRAQDVFHQISLRQMEKMLVASDLLNAVREMQAELKNLEGKEQRFELDSASFELYQRLFKLKDVVAKLDNKGFKPETLNIIKRKSQSLHNVVADSIRHLQDSVMTRTLLQSKLASIAAAESELHNLDMANNPEQNAWLSEMHLALYYLNGAAVNQRGENLHALKETFSKQFSWLQNNTQGDSEHQRLIAKLAALGLDEGNIFDTQIQVLTQKYAFESMVNINVAQVAPLLQESLRLFEKSSNNIQTQLQQQKIQIRYFIVAFIVLALVSIVIGLSLIENLKVRVISRLSKLKKSMHRIVDDSYNAEELKAIIDVDKSDEISVMTKDFAAIMGRINDRTIEIESFARLGKELSGARNLELIIEKTTNHIANSLSFEALVFAVWKEHADEFTFFDGDSNDSISELAHIKASKLMIEDLSGHNEKIIAHNRKELEHLVNQHSMSEIPTSMRSFYYFPLLSHEGQYMGAMTFSGCEDNLMSMQKVFSMTTIAQFMSIAVENALTCHKLQTLEERAYVQQKLLSVGVLDPEKNQEVLDTCNALRRRVLSAKQRHVVVQEKIAPLFVEHRLAILENEIESISKELNRDILVMESQIRVILNVLENVSTLTIPSDGKIEKLDIRSVLEDAIELVGKQFDANWFNVELTDHASIESNRQLLLNILVDVLLNAATSVEMERKSKSDLSGKCEIVVYRQESDVQIRVENNGIQVTQDAAEKLLTRTFSNENIANVGFCLKQAKEAAESLGGGIDLYAKEDGGYGVHVLLPIVPSQ